MKRVLLVITALFTIAAIQAQPCSDLLISEYVEGGGNNKALEIYNASDNPILLSNYKVCRYSNGETNPACVQLQDVQLEPDSVHVGVLDKLDPSGTDYDTMVDPALQAKADTFYCPSYNVNKTWYWNGNDAVSLETTSNNQIVDLMGEVGVNPGEAWTMDTSANFTSGDGGRWWTRNHTLIRHDTIKQGVTTNPSPFIVAQQWDSLPYNTFDHLGWHECNCHPVSIETWETTTHQMMVYPNPVTQNKVVVKASANIKEITIVDLAGKMIFSRNNENKDGKVIIKDLGLEQGLYLLNTRLNDGTRLTKKIYVQ